MPSPSHRAAPLTALAFIPLDDRPCCCQFVERLAEIASLDIETPPRRLLGHLHQPGDCDALLDWLETRAPKTILASLDMLCWGGLVASRQPRWSLEAARRRLQRLAASTADIYATMSLLRTAPTQTSQAEVNLAEQIVELSIWAAREHRGLEGAESRCQELKASIPPQLLQDYLDTRQRNLRLNQQAAEYARGWSALLLGIDDSKTEGWNLMELDQITPHERLLVAPGTDESSQLLLVRLAGAHSPISIETSEPDTGARTTLYEDRPLAKLLQAQMRAAAIPESAQSRRRLFVFGPPQQQLESPHQPDHNPRVGSFIERLRTALKRGYLVAVADVCHANGADRCLAEALIESGIASELVGYSAWNTAGNTLGTALAALALAPEHPTPAQRRAQQDFLLERLADDYLYQSRYRQQLRQEFGPGYTLAPEIASQAQENLVGLLEPELVRLGRLLFGRDLSPQITLPWGRLFEAQILV